MGKGHVNAAEFVPSTAHEFSRERQEGQDATFVARHACCHLRGIFCSNLQLRSRIELSPLASDAPIR